MKPFQNKNLTASIDKTNNTGTGTIEGRVSIGQSGAITKTFSSLANVPRHKRTKLINESKPLLGGARKCKEIWQAIRKADFRNEGLLNDANVRLIFERCRDQIFDLLRLSAPHEFIDVFDQGGDGVLNQDEQILLFSTIKAKM